MRRAIIVGMIVLLVAIMVVIADQPEKNSDICKKACITAFESSYKACKVAYDAGKNGCKAEFEICKANVKTARESCNPKTDKDAFKICMKNAEEQNKLCETDHKACDNGIRGTFLGCQEGARTTFDTCKQSCKNLKDAEDEITETQKLCEKLGGTWKSESGICEFKTCETKQNCIDQELPKNILCLNKQCMKP